MEHKDRISTKETKVKGRDQYRACTLAITLTAVLAGCVTERTCSNGGCTGDEKITADVRKLLDRQLDLAPPAAISVKTVDHVVYLDGTVSAGLQRETIAEIARQAPGVSDVVNSIAISR